MRQASHVRGGLHGRLVIALALSSTGCSVALAADVKSDNGIMAFPNVVVINAPQASQPASPRQGGMRAYKDSPTSGYRGPTSEEMAAESQPASANARRSVDASSSSGAPEFASAAGGVGVMLDDSALVYSVVVRQADGSLAEVCVTGADAANELVGKQPIRNKAAQKEISNVR